MGHHPTQPLYRVSTHSTDPVLRLQGIDLSFGGVRVLNQLDLQVAAGSITAIIGPNGAGKSSLLNVINGIYQPQHGQRQLFNHQQLRLNPTQAARLGVARTFQNLALFGALSVADNIRAGRQLKEKSHWLAQWFGLPAARREQQAEQETVEQILQFLNLSQWRDVAVSSLPYGLQKRVELGRALAAEPLLLLLDEPMAGMNQQEKQQLSGYIRQIRDQFGTSIILIEHDIKVVLSLANHIVVLDYGRKIADGDPDSIRQNPQVLAAYLGPKRHNNTEHPAESAA